MKTKLGIMLNAHMIDHATHDHVLLVEATVMPKYLSDVTSANTFLTHLAIAMHRIKSAQPVEAMNACYVAEIKSQKTFDLATQITKEIEEMVSLTFNEAEEGYIWLHLCTLLNSQVQPCILDGYTLIHEHVTIDLSKVKGDEDTHVTCMAETIEEFKALYQYGVRNIVDVTVEGMGRNVAYVEEVAKASGINILCATGYYKEPFLPEIVKSTSIEALSDKMCEEIVQGIESTSIKASLIGEIGTSLNEMTVLEKKVFDAAIMAHKKTNAVISTHTTLGTMGEMQADYLIQAGVSPSKIIIGHQDLSKNLDSIKHLIKKGVYVGFDTIGKNNYFEDHDRALFIKQLQDEALIDRVVLSMDITRKSNFKYKGGIGYSYMFEVFLPMLRTYGVHEQSIQCMLENNPKRLFNKEVT